MYCSSCGSNINQGENFCRMCGTKIVSQSVQQNSMVQPNINQQNHAQFQPYIPQQVMNNNVLYNQPVCNNYSNDEELINTYIGENVDEIKRGGSSWHFFYHGFPYLFYRKMYLLGFLEIFLLVISCILYFFNNLFFLFVLILYLVANIVVFLRFNKLYLKHVYKKVAEIKTENPNASYEQLLMICNKKGGTSIIMRLLSVIFVCLFAFALGFWLRLH